MGDRLATIDMDRKRRAVPLFGGAGSPSNTMWPGPRPTSVYQLAKWHLDPSSSLTTTDMGQNWSAVPLLGEGGWVPIKHTVAGAEAYLRAKFHLDPSNRLATTNKRYRQTGQTDRTTVQ